EAVLVAIRRGEEQQCDAFARIAPVPTAARNNREVASMQRSRDLSGRLSHRELCFAAKHVEELVACTVQLPRAKPNGACNSSGATVKRERRDRSRRLLREGRKLDLWHSL